MEILQKIGFEMKKFAWRWKDERLTWDGLVMCKEEQLMHQRMSRIKSMEQKRR